MTKRNKLIKLTFECTECSLYYDSEDLDEAITFVMPDDVYKKLIADEERKVAVDSLLAEFRRKTQLLLLDYEWKIYHKIYDGQTERKEDAP